MRSWCQQQPGLGLTLLPPDGAGVHWLGVRAGVNTAHLGFFLSSAQGFLVGMWVKGSAGFVETLVLFMPSNHKQPLCWTKHQTATGDAFPPCGAKVATV